MSAVVRWYGVVHKVAMEGERKTVNAERMKGKDVTA